MRDLPELQLHCRENALHLSPTLRRVVIWIADNLPSVGWSSIDYIARELGVSSASVVRSVQKMGYAGYNQFQQEIRQLLPPSNLVWRLAMTDGMVPNGSSQIIDNEMTNLENMRQISDKSLNELVDAMTSSTKIIVTANLMTAALAEYMAQHWDLVLGNIEFTDSNSVHCTSLLSSLDGQDLLIAVAFPRYSRSTINAIHMARERGIPVIVITDATGPASLDVTHVIKLPITSPLYFPSATSLVVLTQLIAQRILRRNPVEVRERLSQLDQRWNALGFFV